VKIYILSVDKESGKYLAFTEGMKQTAESWTSADEALGALVRRLEQFEIIERL
jgi:hypothetical protein